MTENFREKIEKIKEKVGPKSLYIGRVPEKTKTRFLEIAKEEFEEDYGMLLKNLVDIRDGLMPIGHEEIETKIDILAEEINEIKKKIKLPDKKEIKMLSGRKLNRRNENGKV